MNELAERLENAHPSFHTAAPWPHLPHHLQVWVSTIRANTSNSNVHQRLRACQKVKMRKNSGKELNLLR
jgi:hypothetical protein